MKVAMISDWFFPRLGGVETVVYEISSEMAKRKGIEVEVITGNYPNTFSFQEKVEKMDGFRVRRLSGVIFPDFLDNVYLHPELPFKLKALFKEEDYDVIHAHPLFTPLSALSVSVAQDMHPPRKCVVRSNNTVREEIEGSISRAFYKFMTLSSNPDRVLVPTQRSARFEEENGVNPENIEVVSLGANVEKFNPEKYSEELREELGIGSDVFMLFVGRLFDRKGLKCLLKAMGSCPQEANLKLVVLGEGPLKGELVEMSETLEIDDSVEFVGKKPDSELQKFYASCDFVVAPSKRGEAFGLVIPEAMSSGKPVVAGDIGAYSEVFVEGTGYLVPPKDIQALRDKILKLARDESLREKMGKKARETAVEEYSWKNTVDNLLEVYDEILS